MDRHGLSSHDYVTTGTDMDDRLVSLGGNAPGIARNAFGLRGSVSYLIETAVSASACRATSAAWPRTISWPRSLLEASAAEGANLRTAIAAARRAAAADRSPLVVSHKLARRPLEMPLMDPKSGAARPTPVTLADSRTLTAIEHRERPHGYLVLREGKAVAERLALNEVRVCLVEAACRIAVEAYEWSVSAPSRAAAANRSIPTSRCASRSGRRRSMCRRARCSCR